MIAIPTCDRMREGQRGCNPLASLTAVKSQEDSTMAETQCITDCPPFPEIEGVEFCHCPGYLGYAVNSEGEVLSCWTWGIRRKQGDRRLATRWRLLRGWVDDGYRKVEIRELAGPKKKRRAHQLILEAFVGPRPHGYETRHLDGNPLNNQLTNLKYGTQSENQHDSIRHGTHAGLNTADQTGSCLVMTWP